MESGSRSAVEEAIVRLERQNRNMRVAITLLAVFWMGIVGWLAMRGSATVQAAAPARDSILRTRAVVITDANGVDRLWIGAPLPNPAVFGKRYKRSVEISGVLLLDRDGNERGGYVTDDRGDAFLSLDTVGDEVGDFTSRNVCCSSTAKIILY